MNKFENDYKRLEERMLGPDDYKTVPVQPNGDALVPIAGSPLLTASIIRPDALPITGDRTFVREGVLSRLMTAAEVLNQKLPGSVLDVGYGYRALSVQRSRFAEAKARLADSFEGAALDNAAHRQIAIPEIAGHPTGAAVDVKIVRRGLPLDMGTDLWQFERRSYTYSPEISREARVNRFRLFDAMEAAGFAPFEGEWWHFSYGDKEWAKFYDQPAAIYEQIEFTAVDDLNDV